MHRILVAGAGKIGSLIACLLAESGEYEVYLADLNFNGQDIVKLLRVVPEIKTIAIDVRDEKFTENYLINNKITAVISSLPYFLNVGLAKAAHLAKAHYFDLTEDVAVTREVKFLAETAQTALVPQCGLAPGFISIAANYLMQEFDHCHHVKLRVGALPQVSSNALHYSLTWSTDGLINEYGNDCVAIENGEIVLLKPLEGLEYLQIEGCKYEAFNTSGGLGSLTEIHQGKVDYLNYKTIRYPGHCDKMRFLLFDLALNKKRDVLKLILENAIPKTYQDQVVVYVSVEGMIGEQLIEKNYVKKIYPCKIHGLDWSAIQVSTAAAICAVADLVLKQPNKFQGLVLQESFTLEDILANRFGSYYA